VDKVFKAVAAPAADGSNLTQRQAEFARALAGQPPAVVAAVRNDPRYRPLLNQFINSTVDGTGKSPPSNNNDTTQWLETRGSLIRLDRWLTGQSSNTQGLPPSVAADVVNSPQARAVFANANRYTIGIRVDQTEFTFPLLSQIADTLGSNTPAAKQFTQETAKQIIAFVGPYGDYSSYLDAKDSIGSSNGSPSPALAIAIAQQLQSDGQSHAAQGIINDVCSAVSTTATSSASKALSDYGQQTKDLNWLIANLGAGATPKQLHAAIQNYMDQKGPDWKNAYQQDRANLQALGQNLANDIAQLEALPRGLRTPEVDSTLKSLANNSSVQQSIGFALANDPVSVLGSDGNKMEALAKLVELSKSGGELAEALAPVYLKEKVEPTLLRELKGLQPGSSEYKAVIERNLQEFASDHKILASVAGVKDTSIQQLTDLLPADAAKQSSKELEHTVSENLKIFDRTAAPGLKSMALVLGAYGFYSSIKGAIDKPDAADIFSAFTSAVGISQNAAAVASLFEKTPEPVAAFASGESGLGRIASKVVDVGNLVTAVPTFLKDLQDGNTWGAVGSGAAVGGTLLALLPEETLGDAAQGFVDPVSDFLTVASALIGAGQLLFSGPAQPPSGTEQLAFLKSEGFEGSGALSPDVFRNFQPSNPSFDDPGSSPWKLLVKYAQDKGYNLQNASQRTAFLTWVNNLASKPAINDTNRTYSADGKPASELAFLVQNLNAELEYSKGDVTDFRPSDPGDRNVAAQIKMLSDAFWTDGRARGVIDNNWGSSNDHVVTVNPGPMDAAVVAPQSAYQVDQLLKVIGASGLPPLVQS
jgi:hypothetical protein